ncbi:MAG: hypothetical protein WGN25_06535 [Candidatus Electrothrix sp. GW3-4]|uniref:hypothetical protein n=1 Tax=Candidatus Electrothrix sp. GW3-4 TaxID=3126740 RepID=UPI0030D1B360
MLNFFFYWDDIASGAEGMDVFFICRDLGRYFVVACDLLREKTEFVGSVLSQGIALDAVLHR